MVRMCIDYFSKMVKLVSLQESDKQTVADKFLSIVVSQHGLPNCITSDYDPWSNGHFWDELVSLLDITLTFSMASHPQTDGIAEVKNHTIEQLLHIDV